MSKAILESIENRLSEISELKYVDEDWGQLDNYSPNPPTKFPFGLIDLTNISYSNIGIDRTLTPANRQNATGTITVTIGNIKITNSSARAPQGQKNNAWAIWDLIELVHAKLHGWHPTNLAGALIRTGQQRVIRDDGIQEYRITYSIGLTNV
ncbi:hypothetical protein [Flavobacterium suncheonense]|uniref:Uncharacterized protein n=1 Tax=Flavobacterium suncheonense GH29-5 = DSM 17707 TaxID=1121899 RepID=A0A0A2MBW5_9FLAO|nr:hypothetical protein [Flavobacterium suncheonense]KGO89749.1 hypothetical protein Q764_06050 [Flavobacterium suncheonense GH29-5 = DSM 17707]